MGCGIWKNHNVNNNAEGCEGNIVVQPISGLAIYATAGGMIQAAAGDLLSLYAYYGSATAGTLGSGAGQDYNNSLHVMRVA
jgi:hypothetical protein